MPSYYERNVRAMESLDKNIGCISWLLLAAVVLGAMALWRFW